MKNSEVQYLKGKLKDKLSNKMQKLSLHKELGIENSIRDGIGELSSYDNHPADLASETYEQDKHFALSRHQERQIDEIKAALDRIENGSYGYCDLCGSSIAFERLEALPEARMCLRCEEEKKVEIEDMEYDRPVEQDLLSTPFFRSFTKGDSVIYDGEDTLQDTQKYGSSSGPQDIGVNDNIDYQHTWYESHEDTGYVEDVESISNETYLQQLPDSHGDADEGYVKPKKEENIDYFGEEGEED